jgi:hypothetical protein
MLSSLIVVPFVHSVTARFLEVDRTGIGLPLVHAFVSQDDFQPRAHPSRCSRASAGSISCDRAGAVIISRTREAISAR